jgi:hypothetical protein
VLILAAVIARLILAWGFHGNIDQDSYEIVQGIIRRGGNVYNETARYNYAPPWFLMLGAFSWVQDITGMSAHGVIRTFLTFVDVALAAVLYLVAKRLGQPPLRTALLFLLSPVMILITGYHGPVDGLALLFVWLAVHVQLERPRRWLAVVLAAAAVLVKPIAAPAPLYALAPSFPSYWRRLIVLAWIGALFGLTLLPWAAEGRGAIVRNVLSYAAAGQSSPNAGAEIAGFIRIGILVSAASLAGRFTIDRALLLWGLLTIVTQPFGPEQQYILPIAAAVIRPGAWLAIYSIAATLALLMSPDNLRLWVVGQLGEWLVLLAAAGWLIVLLASVLLPRIPGIPRSPRGMVLALKRKRPPPPRSSYLGHRDGQSGVGGT